MLSYLPWQTYIGIMASHHGQGVSQDSSVLLPRIQTTGPKAGFSNGQCLLSVLWHFSKLAVLSLTESPCKEAGNYARPMGMLKQQWDRAGIDLLFKGTVVFVMFM